jgi:hypothetical protein
MVKIFIKMQKFLSLANLHKSRKCKSVSHGVKWKVVKTLINDVDYTLMHIL